MRESTIARNYAEALFEAGEQVGESERYADLLDALAGAIEAEPQIRAVLESPRVPKDTKHTLLTRALEDQAPERLIKFLGAVIRRGRQGILPAIAREFHALVDIKFNRVHAGVTLAREPDRRLQQAARTKLGEVFEKEVIAHYRTDPSILGGVVVRMGDRIMDGSLRRRLVALKQQLLRG